jgi:hypothetical protein
MEGKMTIIEAITRIKVLKPDTFLQQDIIRWLSVLDGIIKKEIIDTHEGGEDVIFNGYNEQSDLTQEMLVPAPYDDIYLRWLEAQMDYTNGEYNKYNNSMVVYNESYTNFARFYNSTHMPKGKKFKFF